MSPIKNPTVFTPADTKTPTSWGTANAIFAQIEDEMLSPIQDESGGLIYSEQFIPGDSKNPTVFSSADVKNPTSFANADTKNPTAFSSLAAQEIPYFYDDATKTYDNATRAYDYTVFVANQVNQLNPTAWSASG